MRRSALAAAAMLAVLTAVVGCAAESDPPVDPTPTTMPTPAPTAEAIVVGPAEAAPQVFGGDCGAAIDLAVLTEASGYTVAEVTKPDMQWSAGVLSAGGLSCEWEGGQLDIVPRAGLGDARLPAGEYEYYFVNCDWACAWVWETDDLWISGSDWAVQGRTRAQLDAIGAEVGAHIAERWESRDEHPWTRDRAGWLPVLECDAMASAVGQQLGAQVTAQPAGYHDPPYPVRAITDIASHTSWCALSLGDRMFAEVRSSAGEGWDAPRDVSAARVELGIPGISAYPAGEWGYLLGAPYQLTDGINVTYATVDDSDLEWSEQQIITAIAAAAASGFQS